MRLNGLKGQLLLAMPSLMDPNFQYGVVLICHHDQEGCMGFLINRIHHISVGSVLDDMHLESLTPLEVPAFEGGPVEPFRGFVIHEGGHHYNSSLDITHEIQLTTSRDILEGVASGQGPEHFMLVLGYAGWAAGQLEQEISRNDWLIAPASNEIVFRTPVKSRWKQGAWSLGIEPDQLSLQGGHA